MIEDDAPMPRPPEEQRQGLEPSGKASDRVAASQIVQNKDHRSAGLDDGNHKPPPKPVVPDDLNHLQGRLSTVDTATFRRQRRIELKKRVAEKKAAKEAAECSVGNDTPLEGDSPLADVANDSGAREFARATLDKAEEYVARRGKDNSKAVGIQLDPFSPAGVALGAAAFDGDTVAAEAPATKKGKVIVPDDASTVGPSKSTDFMDLPTTVTNSSSTEDAAPADVFVPAKPKVVRKTKPTPTRSTRSTGKAKAGLTRGIKSKQTPMIDKETQKLVDEGKRMQADYDKFMESEGNEEMDDSDSNI